MLVHFFFSVKWLYRHIETTVQYIHSYSTLQEILLYDIRTGTQRAGLGGRLDEMKGPASLAGLKKGEKKSSTRPGHQTRPHLQHLSRHTDNARGHYYCSYRPGIIDYVSLLLLVLIAFCFLDHLSSAEGKEELAWGAGEDSQKKKKNPKQPSLGLRFSIQTECSYEALDQ